MGNRSWLSRIVGWITNSFGSKLYPDKVDICNCGVNFGLQLPRIELIEREGLSKDSQAWRMQMYGAATYYHLATMPSKKVADRDVDMLRGKDVLEVACTRGGGARYLAQVLGPRRYVATDAAQSFIDTCRSSHPPLDNLEFEVADAVDLTAKFPENSFDYVLVVQASAEFGDIPGFVRSVNRVLRPGGRLLMCDPFIRDELKKLLDTFAETGMTHEVEDDISRAVHAVGLCTVPAGVGYLHIIARKADE